MLIKTVKQPNLIVSPERRLGQVHFYFCVCVMVPVVSTTRYSHLANDTLMAAAEAGATKLDVNWSKRV